MPTYDFKCNNCDSVVELIITDDPFPKCEKCDITLTKVFTPPAVLYLPNVFLFKEFTPTEVL